MGSHRHLVTLPAPPIRCLCVDFVRVTNCLYDYNYFSRTLDFLHFSLLLSVNCVTKEMMMMIGRVQYHPIELVYLKKMTKRI